MSKKIALNETTIKDKLTIIEEKNGSDRLSIKFDGEMSIYTINGIAEVLKNGFDSCSNITVDLSGVGRFDSAGLQILLIAKKEAELKKKIFQMINPATGVKRVFGISGEQYNFEEQ